MGNYCCTDSALPQSAAGAGPCSSTGLGAMGGVGGGWGGGDTVGPRRFVSGCAPATPPRPSYVGTTMSPPSPPLPGGTGHPSFSCGPGSVYIQLYRHNDICFPPPPPVARDILPSLAATCFSPPPPVEQDILPSPAALVQFIYNYKGITIYVSPLPPCGTGHPSFSCCPGLWFFCIHSQA